MSAFLHRNRWFVWFLIAVTIALFWPKLAGAQSPTTLYMPQISGHTTSAQTEEMFHVRFGNGMMQNMKESYLAECMDGFYTDLVDEHEGIVVVGYIFDNFDTGVLPSVIKDNGVDQTYLVSFGQELDYLVFDATENGIVVTQWTNFTTETPFDVSEPTTYLGWELVLEGNSVTLTQKDSTVKITASGEYFCTEIQTPENTNDTGIMKSFIINKSDERLANLVYSRWTK